MNLLEEDIFAVFYQNADQERAQNMAAYMRNLFPFLGISKPERGALSKGFLKECKKAQAINWHFIEQCWSREREFQYLALDYLKITAHLLTPADVPRLKNLAINKSWWDTIDFLDRIIGGIALRYPEVNDILLAWSTDDNIWLRRIAIDHQLLRKNKTNTKLLESILVNNLGQKEFFINKAIGWSLRDYSKTDPEWVRAFIDKHQNEMAALSVREASKYI